MADPVFGQLGRQRNKDFAGGVAVDIVLRVVVSLWWWAAFICIIFAVAEAAELVGDSFDGGFG